VRVIAEQADGSLLVAQRFIKAGPAVARPPPVKSIGRAPCRNGPDEMAHGPPQPILPRRPGCN